VCLVRCTGIAIDSFVEAAVNGYVVAVHVFGYLIASLKTVGASVSYKPPPRRPGPSSDLCGESFAFVLMSIPDVQKADL
jgi:hypothetical protein